MTPELPLPDDFLRALIAELDDANTVGLALTGSHARGEATPYSDVDLHRYVVQMPANEPEQYVWGYRGDWLVSVTVVTAAAKRESFTKPVEAIWTVPGLRQYRILLDKDGSLDQLRQEALDFRWEPLQAAADAYASYDLAAYAEEVHKILGGLARRDDSAVLYAALGLVFGLPRTLAVWRGVLIETENAFFRLAQQAAGPDSAWSRALRMAAGFDPAPDGRSPVEARGMAGLQLYRETAALMRGILKAEHAAVVERVLTRIEEAEFTIPPDPQ